MESPQKFVNFVLAAVAAGAAAAVVQKQKPVLLLLLPLLLCSSGYRFINFSELRCSFADPALHPTLHLLN